MLTLTDSALTKIRASLKKRKIGVGIRIGVKTTGCSGLAYVLEYIDTYKFDAYDNEIQYPDFIIKIAIKDMVYLDGTVVDFVRNGLNEGFEFRNPNERDRCGCGSSFRV
jgi:iron-sulfur cluster assembly protein